MSDVPVFDDFTIHALYPEPAYVQEAGEKNFLHLVRNDQLDRLLKEAGPKLRALGQGLSGRRFVTLILNDIGRQNCWLDMWDCIGFAYMHDCALAELSFS